MLPEVVDRGLRTFEDRVANQFALANPDVLRQIPCYCGCRAGHGGDAHKSVKDCFVREVKPDGTIVWDDMGLG